mmetsp:Transcript_44123/g.103056  ORF Transcript_44123/g.103056 Transcript_44123/m.103056 type:complete len:112 (-) Transcript_44123:283-618(-)
MVLRNAGPRLSFDHVDHRFQHAPHYFSYVHFCNANLFSNNFLHQHHRNKHHHNDRKQHSHQPDHYTDVDGLNGFFESDKYKYAVYISKPDHDLDIKHSIIHKHYPVVDEHE